MTFTQKDPVDLKPHPKVKSLLRWTKGSEEFNTLADSVRDHGVMVPIIITADGLIMDGVTRWSAAKQMQITQVPCQVRPESELEIIAIGSETQRRHLTKSQLAFKYYSLIADVFGERTAQMEEWKKAKSGFTNRQCPHSVRALGKRVTEFASKLGVSTRLLEQADQLHTLFEETDEIGFSWTSEDAKKVLFELGLASDQEHTLRTYFSGAIMQCADPMSLGGAISGAKFRIEQRAAEAKGRKHTGNSPVDAGKQLSLFNRVISDQLTRWDYWQRFDQTQQEEHINFVRKQASAMPAEQCASLANYHRTLARLFDRQAKQES